MNATRPLDHTRTSRTASPAARDLIDQAEACKLRAYLCPSRKVTIGRGHVIQPSWDAHLFGSMTRQTLARIIADCERLGKMTQEAQSSLRILQKQADELFDIDIRDTESLVNSLLYRVTINQNQFDALISFVFNIGQDQFANSTLRKKLLAGDYEGAAAQFDRWIYETVTGKKVVMPGLVKRRAAERALFESPDLSPGANP